MKISKAQLVTLTVGLTIYVIGLAVSNLVVLAYLGAGLVIGVTCPSDTK